MKQTETFAKPPPEIKGNVEFKVTPYTIVNYTTKTVRVKRLVDRNNDGPYHIPKEYVIKPGEQIDYEVDYEEEARQLMRISRDELIRKQDFIRVMLEDERGLK